MYAPQGLLYGIHFDGPFGHALHYKGWSRSRAYLIRRIGHHARGSGSRLMRAVSRAGIGWAVVYITPGSRTDERRWKNQGGHPERWCPTCQGRKSRLRAPYWRFDPAPANMNRFGQDDTMVLEMSHPDRQIERRVHVG